MTAPEEAWDGDPWAGMVDEAGVPIDPDEIYEENIAPHVTSEAVPGSSPQEAIAGRYRLPEEFWGAREMFKRIRQAAWASQNHPDAVLACILARAAGASGQDVSFDSGDGTLSTMSLFVCLLSPSGVGKSKAHKAAGRLMNLPRHLLAPDGTTDMEVFRDGLSIGSGEGLAETYMGTVEQETGRTVMTKGRNPRPEPEMAKVRTVVRHRAYFYVDEGEALTKLMRERQGSTLGPMLRTAWSGGTLSQANATEDRFRFVPGGTYSMGIAIGYQPDTAVAMLSDVGPGTPQRFLWFGAQDTEMPDPDEADFEWPESMVIPPEDAHTGVIAFPPEIRRWLRKQHWRKHTGEVVVNPMDSQEPMMRCKLAALLCWLDGRSMVTRDDWLLGGMLWSVSSATRDRLIAHRDAEARRVDTEQRERRLTEATEIAVMQVEVNTDVERVARRIAVKTREAHDAGEPVKRYKLREGFGRDKKLFNVGLSHARSMDWIAPDEVEGCLVPGGSQPAG